MDYQNEIDALLADAAVEKIVYPGETQKHLFVYYVEKETLDALIRLEKQIESGTGVSSGKRGLYPYVGIISEEVVYRKSISFKKAYVNVSDPDSLYRHLEGRFKVWENTVKKRARKSAGAEGVDDDTAKRYLRDAQREIEAGRKEFEKLQSLYQKDGENTGEFRGLEVRLTNYRFEQTPIKAWMNCYSQNNKSSQVYLREEVPNIICFEDRSSTLRRSDLKIENFLNRAKKAFGNIYYIEKEES